MLNKVIIWRQILNFSMNAAELPILHLKFPHILQSLMYLYRSIRYLYIAKSRCRNTDSAKIGEGPKFPLRSIVQHPAIACDARMVALATPTQQLREMRQRIRQMRIAGFAEMPPHPPIPDGHAFRSRQQDAEPVMARKKPD